MGSELYFSVGGERSGVVTDELEGVISTISAILDEAQAAPTHIVKLTAFYVADGDDEAVASALRLALRDRFPAPVLTIVQVAALSAAGQRLQGDRVCIAPAP